MSRFDVNRNRFDAIDDGADLSNLIEPILALLGVLLIFVVVGMTVPTLTTVASELAETNGDDLEGDVEDAIVISLTADGGLHLNGTSLDIDDLSGAISDRKATDTIDAVYLVGDVAAPYGASLEVKDVLREHQLKVKEVTRKKGN